MCTSKILVVNTCLLLYKNFNIGLNCCHTNDMHIWREKYSENEKEELADSWCGTKEFLMFIVRQEM